MSKICLIDGDSLIYMASFPKDGVKTVDESRENLKARIAEIANRNNTDKIAICLTGKNNYRKKQWKYSKEYKLARKAFQVLPPIFFYLKEWLIQEYHANIYDGLEADDIVTYFYNTESNCMICSPDKDVLYQNAGMHFNYRTNEFIEITKETSEMFTWKQVIQGDATDSVAGVEGIGEKTVDKIFKNTKNRYYEVALHTYINKYGVHEGVNRFYETFSMVYLLRTREDMMREVGYIPELKYIILSNETKSLY